MTQVAATGIAGSRAIAKYLHCDGGMMADARFAHVLAAGERRGQRGVCLQWQYEHQQDDEETSHGMEDSALIS